MDMTTSMTAAPVTTTEGPSLRTRVVDAARRAVRQAQRRQPLKAVAADALENQIGSARRAFRSAVRDLSDVRDDAAYRIKKTPLKSVGVAFGTGLCLGVAAGTALWLSARTSSRAAA